MRITIQINNFIMDHYIIDGYNLIHAIPSLKKTLNHHAESARELLIHAVEQLAVQKNIRCSIIFDGHSPVSFAKHSAHGPVHVIHSAPHSADEKITKMIEESNRRIDIVVITSDQEILRRARAFSCRTHSSKHFANLLSEISGGVEEKSDEPMSEHQVSEWLRIFGEKRN